MSVPQAAGITGLLTAAGLSSAAVHEWFNEPRAELGRPTGDDGWMTWLTPRLALELDGAAVDRVIQIARADAAAISAALPRGWEGSQ